MQRDIKFFSLLGFPADIRFATSPRREVTVICGVYYHASSQAISSTCKMHFKRFLLTILTVHLKFNLDYFPRTEDVSERPLWRSLWPSDCPPEPPDHLQKTIAGSWLSPLHQRQQGQQSSLLHQPSGDPSHPYHGVLAMLQPCPKSLDLLIFAFTLNPEEVLLPLKPPDGFKILSFSIQPMFWSKV